MDDELAAKGGARLSYLAPLVIRATEDEMAQPGLTGIGHVA